MLHFSTGDHATDHNLQRLSHLASRDRFDDDPEQMHQWLLAVIGSVEALPAVARVHFKGHYFLGDSHFRLSGERRIAEWRKLVEELNDHVTAAHADVSLRADGVNGRPDLSDRRETLGERIIALCEKLEQASWGTAEFDRILGQISAIAVRDVRSDIAELKRLSSRKRIPDVSEHRYWIVRHISHMRLVADQLHHLA